MDETRLGDAVATYLELQRRGEAPPLDDYAARHGDLAGELKKCLAPLDGREIADSGVEPGLPREFGDFTLTKVLGRGGMGVVYAADQKSLRRRVALKVLSSADAGGSAHARFLREVELSAELKHPHIVEVLQAGTHDGVPWFAMPLLEGSSLDRVIAAWRADRATEPLASGRNLATWIARFAEATRALAAAHAAGVHHRDLKPSNLFLEVVDRPSAGSTAARSTTRLRLLDFGLARRSDGSGTLQTQSPVGTPRYMSPEQIVGDSRAVDERSDVWSLGATLYELVTLQPAFAGAEREAIYRAILLSDPKPPRKVDPRVPRDLENVILKAIEKRPERRYATADDFADDLQRFVDFQPVRARPIGLLGRLARRTRRNPVVAGAIAVALLAVVAAGVALSIVRARDAARREQQARDQVAVAVAAAATAGDRVTAIEAELRALEAKRGALELAIAAWAPVGEKSERLALAAQRDALVRERDRLVDATTGDLLRAMRLVSGDRAAAAALGDFATAAYRGAEASLDHERMERFRGFVEQFRGPLQGAVRITADAPGVRAWLFRYVKQGALLVPAACDARGELLADALDVFDADGPWTWLEVTRAAGEKADAWLRAGDRIERFCEIAPPNLVGIQQEIAAAGIGHVHHVRRVRDGSAEELEIPCRDLSGLDGKPVVLDPFPLARRGGNSVALEPSFRAELPVGSYLALLECSGYAPVRLPFRIHDGRTLELDAQMPEAARVPPGFVAIHGGPTWLGGDPEAGGSSHGREERVETFFIARLETTIDEYVRFVESVLRDHPDPAKQAPLLLPKFSAGRNVLGEWKEGRLVLAPSPWTDDDGLYSRSLGLYHVKLEQIRRYCAWRTEELGDDEWEFDLPTAAEWERAARGVDGRRFPWGDEFDWTFAKNAFASPLGARGLPIPEPGGLFPIDASPFGVLDMAANMRELALEPDGSWRLRGASWGLNESNAFHCAARSTFGEVNLGQSGLGFRLVLRRKKA